jgi:hypothetical protein
MSQTTADHESSPFGFRYSNLFRISCFVFRISAVLFCAAIAPASAQPPAQPLVRHLADYDSEIRLHNGPVDTDAMVSRLKELGVNNYYWLIWHRATDWNDLQLFLPKAAKAGINVWVYLVPPSECPPKFSDSYSEPFRLDYARWAEEIARLSLQHPNLKGWLVDDFYANRDLFTPAYMREIRDKYKAINPQLAFLPLLYLSEVRPKFVEDYRDVIDGVVVAYLRDRHEIDRAWAILNDAPLPAVSEITYPDHTRSQVGDYAMAAQSARVLPADQYKVSFLQRDDFPGPTAGYHFKQLLIDGAVAWEEDVAGGPLTWQKVTVDVTRYVQGKDQVTLAFRLLDKNGVYAFGVQWRVDDLRADNLQLVASLDEPQKWKVGRRGAFETGFGSMGVGRRRFHIPLISMTAGQKYEFRIRHGDPATPERIAMQLRVSLQAYRDGKCDGVVTYGLDKEPNSQMFPYVQELFRRFGDHDR